MESKVVWTLTRDVRAKEYIISFRYIWPVKISINDMGELAGHAASAINTDLTRIESDDVYPRILYVHVNWLPYRARPLGRAKMFIFYPDPVIHLTEPTMGVDRAMVANASTAGNRGRKQRPRSRTRPGLLQTLTGFLPGMSQPDSDMDDDDSVVDVDRGEPKLKKRKIEETE